MDFNVTGQYQGDPRFGDIRFGGYNFNDNTMLARTYTPPPPATPDRATWPSTRRCPTTSAAITISPA